LDCYWTDQTGGHLLTLEIDEGRAKLAQENFKAAALDSLIELKLGDALREIPKLKGPHDFVFIDADKSDYLRVSTGLKGSEFRHFGGSQRSSVSVSGTRRPERPTPQPFLIEFLPACLNQAIRVSLLRRQHEQQHWKTGCAWHPA
jgi:hypothetical protein